MFERWHSTRRAPARYAAISASHEIHPSLDAAARAAVSRRVSDEVARRAEGRRARGYQRRRVVESTPLLRSMDGGLDDLKFLYPVLDNVPLIVFPLLSYALTGAVVSVYGPREVGWVVDVVRARLVADGLVDDVDRILFAEEDRREVSFWRSLRGSTAPLRAPRDAMIVWSAGDLVLGYNTYRRLHDRHLASHDLVFDLNAKQVVFPPGAPELFPRNYFDSMRLDGDGERVVDVKEPNVLLFSPAGLEALARLDELRRPPPGATYMGVLLRSALGAALGASPRAVLSFAWYGLRRTREALRERDGLGQRHASELASAIFGVPTVVKAENVDPFLVRDCDSFEDLFGYYRTLLQPIVDAGATPEEGYRALSRHYPYAEVLLRVSADLRPLWREIPLWRRWTELMPDKIATHNRMLAEARKSVGLDGLEAPVPAYFDGRGRFHGAPRPTDDIRASAELLRGAYRAAFEEDREAHERSARRGRAPVPRQRADNHELEDAWRSGKTC